jgi:hypothetical protein
VLTRSATVEANRPAHAPRRAEPAVLTKRAAVPADRSDAHELTAALEAALVRELRAAWWQVNEAYFRSGLKMPTLELVAGRSHLGRWVQGTRTIEISRPMVLEQPWGAVIEVLKHEMAHQYVHEVLGEADQSRIASSIASRACSPWPRAPTGTRPRPPWPRRSA